MSNTDKITIHDAQPEDAIDIVHLRRKTWLTTYPNAHEGITLEDIEATLNSRTIEKEAEGRKERIQNNHSYHTWVAKQHDKVIGFIEVQRNEPRNNIRALYILHDYQTIGCGSQLMKKGLSWLGNEKEIQCEVVTYNLPAITFYKKFGFIENGHTQNDVAKLPSGKVMPEIEMVKKIIV